MKLNSFDIDFQSTMGGKQLLKLKSLICMKQVGKLKSFLTVFGMVFFIFFAGAQNQEKRISHQTIETTTVLLKELERKVFVYNEFKDKLNSIKNKHSSEYEECYTQLRTKKEDLIFFSYETLRIRCAKENRLNEIGDILMKFDSSEASKFIKDHNFLNSKK